MNDQVITLIRDDGHVGALHVDFTGTTAAYDNPIEDLDLTVRSYNCLKREHIRTIAELLARSEQDLLDIRWFGVGALRDVREKLAAIGLELSQGDRYRA